MNYKLLNDIINYIESNIQEDLDYKKIASKFGMNEFIMQRVFSVIMGITLSDYVRERRLSKAYEEILNTDKRIIDIAFDCGYESSIAFSRAFKKLLEFLQVILEKNNLKNIRSIQKLSLVKKVTQMKLLNIKLIVLTKLSYMDYKFQL